jgi:DUF971 family protein
MAHSIPLPTALEYHQKSRLLEIHFDTDEHFSLSAEFLRVYSPSAEVRGHGPGQETLQIGKADVMIERIEPVGTYAVQLYFDDGHNSGIYSWDWLYYIAKEHDTLWATYLDNLEKAGSKRAPVN